MRVPSDPEGRCAILNRLSMRNGRNTAAGNVPALDGSRAGGRDA